jgi:CBS domain-containing protein
MTTVQQIMTRNPVTCSCDASTNEATRTMWEHDIGMLAVTDANGRVIGAITDRDVAMAAYIQGKPLAKMPVQSAMSNRIFTARPSMSLAEVERIMADNQIRRVPVVDDAGCAIGMISVNDLAMHSSSSRGAAVPPNDLASTLQAICRPRTSLEVAAE